MAYSKNGAAGPLQALRDGQDTGLHARDVGEQRGEHPRLVIEHHGEDGLSGAGHVGGLEDIVLVFVVRTPGDSDLLHRLADLADLPALHQPPALQHLLVIIGQNAFMNDQIV